jgi:hypothetical protein
MVALPRPDSWDFPLLLHVLGAVVLFGGAATVGVLAFASLRREPSIALVLRRLAFRTMLFVVLPAFVVMRVGAEWIRSKEFPDGNPPNWVEVGYVIADAGVLVLALLTLFSWLGVRGTRPDQARPRSASVAAGLAILYVVALGVAWFAMTAKPGA